MRNVITALAAVAVLASGAGGQEAERKPADVLREALRKSLDSGSIVFEGDCQYKMFPDVLTEVLSGYYGEGGISGHVTARVGKDGSAAVVVETGEACVEIYAGAGGRTAQRAVWTSESAPNRGGVHQLLNLIRMARIANRADDAKSLSYTKQAEDASVLVSGAFPGDLLGDDFSKGILDLKSTQVQLNVLVGADDGLIRKMEARVTRQTVTPPPILGAPPGFQVETPPPADASAGLHTISTYTVKVVKYDAELKVEIPAEMKKYLGE